MSVELRLFRVQHSNNVNSALRLKGVRSQESGGREKKKEKKIRRRKRKEEVKTCSSPGFIINSCLTPLGWL